MVYRRKSESDRYTYACEGIEVVVAVAVVEEDGHTLDMFGMYGCLVADSQGVVVQASLLALLFNVNLKLNACLKK
jgi:hypothetical protein